MPDDSLVSYVDLNEVENQKKFTATYVSSDEADARNGALSLAQNQVYASLGPNAQFTGYNDIYVKIDTGPNGQGFTYTATATVRAFVPTPTVTPLTPLEQVNLNNPPVVSVTADTATTTNTVTTEPPSGNVATVPATNNTTVSAAPDNATLVTNSQPSTPAGIQTFIENPLHEYDSYTYALSIHLLGVDYFNSLINSDSPNKVYRPQNVLVSSAGKWSGTFPRDPSFTEDFYFDDFKMTTIVNTTARNRNSNLIECNFTLIETAGFTFINRLIEAAYRVNSGPGNYLQMPYMLQIDFYGYRDGELVPGPIPNLTKYIPIRLVNLKSRVSTRGAEYRIDAVPFNHQAFNQLNISSPAEFTITGDTVQNIFGTGSSDPNFSTKMEEKMALQREERFLKNYVNAGPSAPEYSAENAAIANSLLSTVSSKIKNEYSQFGVNGFTDAINTYYQNLKNQGQISQVNVVRVEFHPDIAGKSIFKSAPVNVGQTNASGNTESSKKSAIQAAGGSEKGKINFNGTTMNIPAGTSIDKLIDWVVRNSEYIGEQISDPNKLKSIQDGQSPFGAPLKWYRIIPKVKILNFDPVQNRYALDITYYVKPFYLSSKYPFAPKGRRPGYVKRYDYIFTGKNKDVVDLQLDFDMLYLVELHGYKAKRGLNKTADGVNNGSTIDPSVAEPTPEVSDPNSPKPQVVAPLATGIVADNITTMDRAGGLSQLSIDAGALHRSLMIGGRGDMVNVKLKIIGDPHFIKQDDIFYGQSYGDTPSQFTNNQSLYMDGGELYVWVNFETPMDYDETTGLANPGSYDNRYRYSEFSGIYKIITVETTFVKGKFEQTLDLAKLLFDHEGNPITSNSQRAEIAKQQALAPLVPNNPVRFAGPAIIGTPGFNPVTNTAAAVAMTAGLISSSGGGGGGGSSLAATAVSMFQSYATKELNKAVGKVVNDALGKLMGLGAAPSLPTTTPGVQVFEDGSTLQTFDDGSTLAIGTDGSVSATNSLDNFSSADVVSVDPASTVADGVTNFEEVDVAALEDLGFDDFLGGFGGFI